MKRALPGTAGAPDQTSIPDLEAWKQRAVTLATSYERTGDLHLLTQAIELFRKIASAPGLATADRAGQLGNLVNALALLFECTGDPAVREKEALAVARALSSLPGAGRSKRAF